MLTIASTKIVFLETVPVFGDVTLCTVSMIFAIKKLQFVPMVVRKKGPDIIVTSVSHCETLVYTNTYILSTYLTVSSFFCRIHILS